MMKMYNVALLGFIILCSACKKDPLANIDKDALFGTPTSGELEAIQTSWEKRDLNPVDIKVEKTYPAHANVLLKIISFRSAGYKQYAGVLIPFTTKPLPVRMYVTGFSLKDATSEHNIKIGTDSLRFVYMLPALKGQSLRLTVDGILYETPVSEGTRNDAFDGAADDAIASLNAVVSTCEEADGSKVMIQGGSRGGTVALLMAERDKRVKLAEAIAFPSDLLSLTATHQNDPTYKFQFLDDLISGKATLKETRLKLIASSPLYFCKQLPKTQVHFGDKDVITPKEQGERLFDAMKAAGREADMELFIYSGRSHEDIGNDNTEMQERIEGFFKQIYAP
ncbi:prolyl oligopeptidase family serine peptidase [Chitinophaga agrisoli]|uniref:Prolyl oligopeptidase family serine peptidase n=1 Tax=Chitinophaga agrisoli TaxID=2607653 RepID=A0A5B2VK09_9BACT|nr:prolyl oligopeptidase family serine peptidase [Chitinophaga agrisoli]KAA2238567.1 prolyl oligopeptidase family serine peptidase [Chitinophaga agrisoli]